MDGDDFPPKANRWGLIRPNTDDPWSILAAAGQSVMDKMHSKGTPLEHWDVRINFGIKTGYNKAFIIDEATRRSLVAADSKSEEIIKPVLRGRDVQRYQPKWAGKYLIDTHNGYGKIPAININDYPAVKTHLDVHYSQLQKRQDKGRTPYNLRNCAYYEDFAKEKLLWIELVGRGRFAYDNTGIIGEATTFTMTGEHIKYLCGVLNARLIRWYLWQIAPTSGMGTLRWKKVYVQTIPVPRLSAAMQRPLVRLVERILKAKASNPNADTAGLESEIDRRVYALYGLTDEEIAAVEGRG